MFRDCASYYKEKYLSLGLSKLNLPELIMISTPSPWVVSWGRGNLFWCHIENQFWPTALASCLSGGTCHPLYGLYFPFFFALCYVFLSLDWFKKLPGPGNSAWSDGQGYFPIKKITRTSSWGIKDLVGSFSCVVCIVWVFSTEKHRQFPFGLAGKSSWITFGQI
jgi:hypothetical protein